MNRTEEALGGLAARLSEAYGGRDGEALLRPLIQREFPGRIALVSSFGAESALLLDMVARIEPAVPVIFLNSGKLFGETLRYRERLTERLGLRDVREVLPDPEEVTRLDRDGMLFRRNPDACCALRKVEPLRRALSGFTAWISGRKRYQGGERAALPLIEAADGFLRINPLASWSRARIEQEFAARALPPHPLEAEGFASIGCMPCTDRVAMGEDQRAGRWRGLEKTECGIHAR
ncbi:MAG TPA: phosphoadenylyl-sulfate reductase [Stellaceae bacterium]|nr:phosphoadenylyl-sulfate reductase [Stellaceae bacterium]